MLWHNIIRTFVASWVVYAATFGTANAQPEFSGWLEQEIWPLARANAVSRHTFDDALGGVRFNAELPGLASGPRKAQQHQPEFRAPAAYFGGNGLAELTREGSAKAKTHARFLRQLETQTGVPGRILLAIWGRESHYGGAPLRHDVFQVLASRAFDTPRSRFYSEQLISALQILQRSAITRDEMNSNWAGAMGQPQFMPDSYLRYSADGDGDGKADIWHSERDTLASIARYLKDNGWVAGRDWGFEVTVPQSLSCTLEGPDQGRLIRAWAAMGARRVGGGPFPKHETNRQGFLLMPAGRFGPAFIVTPNFYVLKTYNESDLYALLVGHLGDRLAFGMGDFVGDWVPTGAMRKTQIIGMQRRLTALGHDVGGIDGLVGFKTRRSIGFWQTRNGQDATCFPDRGLLRNLR